MPKKARGSVVAATSAIFGALSALLAVMPLSFPFPLIPYLKFDVAELPVVVAFLGFGPLPGSIAAITYWMVLNVVGEWAPIGPLMKFLSVSSMLLGFWAGYRFTSRFRAACLLAFIFGSLLRVAVMTAANYVVLVILFPFFLDYAVAAVSMVTGWALEPGMGGLMLVMLFTAVFNVIHVAISLAPSALIVQNLARDGLFLGFKEPWMMAAHQRKRL